MGAGTKEVRYKISPVPPIRHTDDGFVRAYISLSAHLHTHRLQLLSNVTSHAPIPQLNRQSHSATKHGGYLGNGVSD